MGVYYKGKSYKFEKTLLVTLKKIAKEKGMRGYSKFSKKQLWDEIFTKERAGPAGVEGWDDFEIYIRSKNVPAADIKRQKEQERQRLIVKTPIPPKRTTSLVADKIDLLKSAKTLIQKNNFTNRLQAVDYIVENVDTFLTKSQSRSLLNRWWPQISK